MCAKWDLKSRLSKLLLQESMSDVTFLVDDPPETCPCHKLILAAGSRVFEAMFYGAFAADIEVQVPDITYDGFCIMLKYLYADEIVIQSYSEALEAAYASKKYMIGGLFDACEDYMLSYVELTPHSVISLLDEACFLDMARFKSKCLRFISRNSTKTLKYESFPSASKETIKDILNLDLMDINSEAEVIEALWLWGRNQCSMLDMKCSNKNIRLLTKEFWKYLRILSMDSKDIEKTIQKCPFLDLSDQLSVIWNNKMPSFGKSSAVISNFSDVLRPRSLKNCSVIDMPVQCRYSGDIYSYTVPEYESTLKLSVSGSNLVLIGLVLKFNPIPCYSATDRWLKFQMKLQEPITNSSKLFDDEKKVIDDTEHELIFDHFVEIGDGTSAILQWNSSAEGVKIGQPVKDYFVHTRGETTVECSFNTNENSTLLPFEKLMCVFR